MASQIIGTLVRNPNAQRIGKRVVRGGAMLARQAIVSRRARRRAAGKKVIFPYLEQNIAAVKGRAIRAPVAVAKQASQANPKAVQLVRSEYTMPVSNSVDYKGLVIDLACGDELYFPALAAHASQYMFGKFNGVSVHYDPQTPTNTAGQIAVSVLPSWEAVLKVQNWNDIVALAATKTTTVWAPMVYNVDMSNLNTQVKEWKVVTPSSEIDYRDPLQSQGFVIIAVQGCAATDTAAMGRLTLTYNATLMKPKLEPVLSSTNHWFGATAAEVDLLRGADHYSTMEIAGPATQPIMSFTLFGSQRAVVYATGSTAGVVTPGGIAAGTGCAVTVLHLHEVSADTFFMMLLVEPTGVSSECTFQVQFAASTLDYTGLRAFVRACGRERFWAP